MNIFKSKKNINEEKIKIKKTISLLGKTISSDWKILVSALFVFLILGLLFSWNLYKTISNQSFLNEDGEAPKNSLKVNTEQLDRVLESLNSRKEKFDKLNNQ
jgi:hypothetical protein